MMLVERDYGFHDLMLARQECSLGAFQSLTRLQIITRPMHDQKVAFGTELSVENYAGHGHSISMA
jgi:hypothetical protein